jgi:hypothetical protein
VYCAGKFRGAKLHGDGEAHANNMEKWQDGRLLRHLGGSCGLRARLLRCLDGSKQQRHHRLPCGRALQRGRWLIPDGLIKRRSRVLRRRTRQAALDKPRVHDGQLGFAILEQKAAETAENRAFEEKQPLVFLPKAANSWIHGGVRPQEARIWSWRRRWGEGSQNTAMLDSPDGACGQGKLTFDVRRSSSRALSRHLRALLSACGKSCGLSRGPPLPARTPKVSSYISNGRDRENNDRDRS